PIDSIVYLENASLPQQLHALLSEADAAVYAVSEAVLHKCTDAKTPQTIFAVVNMPAEANQEELIQLMRSHAGGGPWMLCDGLQDPGNLGTIIRSADAAGAAGVIVSQDSADVYQPKTVRATMGSIFHLPVLTADLEHVLQAAAHLHYEVW